MGVVTYTFCEPKPSDEIGNGCVALFLILAIVFFAFAIRVNWTIGSFLGEDFFAVIPNFIVSLPGVILLLNLPKGELIGK
jgi:hypothetical protein